MNAKILRLNKAGTPVSWLSREETATLLVKDQVIWSLGDTVMEIRGGYNRKGDQSILRLPSIVACDGKASSCRESNQKSTTTVQQCNSGNNFVQKKYEVEANFLCKKMKQGLLDTFD